VSLAVITLVSLLGPSGASYHYCGVSVESGVWPKSPSFPEPLHNSHIRLHPPNGTEFLQSFLAAAPTALEQQQQKKHAF